MDLIRSFQFHTSLFVFIREAVAVELKLIDVDSGLQLCLNGRFMDPKLRLHSCDRVTHGIYLLLDEIGI